jgi:hypothetical protein
LKSPKINHSKNARQVFQRKAKIKVRKDGDRGGVKTVALDSMGRKIVNLSLNAVAPTVWMSFRSRKR